MRHNKQNILHVLSIYYQLHYFIGDQFLYFKGKGAHEHVICSNHENLKSYAKKMGFEYSSTPIQRHISLKTDLKSLIHISRYIRKNNIGIVVGHSPKGGLLAMLAAFICNVPTRIYFRHGLVYETATGFLRKLLIACDKITSLCATKIVCVSNSVLRQSIKDKLGSVNKQIVLGKGTCTGIDTRGKFNPENINPHKLSNLKSKWGIEDGDFVLGYSGRMAKDKGIPQVVQAFEMAKKKYPKLKLLLMGPFDSRDILPNAIKDKILNYKDIIWTDFIDEDQEYFYAMMNVYILASYREGFPIGILEAQSMGVPGITTKVTGCIDSIISEKTGLFIEDIDKNNIFEAICYYIDNNLNKQYSKNARKWVSDNFDQSIVWKHIEQLYS